MNIEKTIRYYRDLVYRHAENSDCLSRSVGAIIVVRGRVVAEGWNSPPRKCEVSACLRCKPDANKTSGKNLESALCTHAEINAISSAADLGFSTRGAAIWTTTKPCAECAKAISACGIAEVHWFEDYHSPYTDMIFEKAGIIATQSSIGEKDVNSK